MVDLPFRQHCRLCAVLAEKIKGKTPQLGGFFPTLKIPPMQSVASGCSCHLPSTVRLHSTGCGGSGGWLDSPKKTQQQPGEYSTDLIWLLWSLRASPQENFAVIQQLH